VRKRALASVAVAVLALSAATASAASEVQIPVVRCPTVFGATGQARHVPSRLAVATAAQGLAAYTNTQIYLLGPQGLRCHGLVAADGGQQVVVWQKGQPRPSQHAHREGLTLTVDSACAGCRAYDACPFFPALAHALGFPCVSGVPPAELVAHPQSAVALFEDPGHVAGSGWPSGGAYTANGVVGTRGSPADGLVYRATCTLPDAQHSTCTASLDDVIARYG
jgi:hypothetical protein